MDLLRYMFERGHLGDIAWFVSGFWLLALFVLVFLGRFFKKKPPTD